MNSGDSSAAGLRATQPSEKEQSYMERRRVAFYTAGLGSALRDGLFSIDDDWLQECETIWRAWINEF